MTGHPVVEGGISGGCGSRPGAAGGQVVHVRGREHAVTRAAGRPHALEDVRLRRATAGQPMGSVVRHWPGIGRRLGDIAVAIARGRRTNRKLQTPAAPKIL